MPSDSRRSALRIGLGMGVVGLALLPVLWLINARVPRPANLGAREGTLAACPPSPNCVVSQGAEGGHAIAPLRWSGASTEAWAALREVMGRYPGATLVTESGGYLHYECRTRLCRFVDDVEFLLDEPAQVIHVRSASRLGHSDLGANRDRVERVRKAFEARRAEALR